MQYNNTLSAEQGFVEIAGLNIKSGKFPVFACIMGVILILAGIALTLILFPAPSSDSKEFSDWISIFIANMWLALLFMVVINLVSKAVALKVGGCGRLKLHLGLVYEVYGEKPVKRSIYLWSEVISIIIAVVVPAILLLFFWKTIVFLMFVTSAVNLICNTPLFIFLLRQPKKAYIKLEQGKLLSLIEVNSNRTGEDNIYG